MEDNTKKPNKADMTELKQTESEKVAVNGDDFVQTGTGDLNFTMTDSREISVAHESAKIGLPPGTLIYVDNDEEEIVGQKSTVRLIEYNEAGYTQRDITSAGEIDPTSSADKVVWLHMTGLWNVEMVRQIGELYNISPLTLEDALTMGQRPKSEEFDNYIFTIFKHLRFDTDANELVDIQISIVTLDRVVLTLCEKEIPAFDAVVKRIQKDGRLRKAGSDYLTYSLIDVVVDHYFYVLEAFEEWFDEVEKKIIKQAEKDGAEEINKMRHELSSFYKAVWPLSTAIDKLEKSDSKLIRKQTRVFFRDVYDHVVRITESVESDREMLTGVFDLYTSRISNRLNETMKILTIISTIFIPLTFIAGVYGMNFTNMPEVHWKYGYYACLCFMFIIFVTMVFFFKRKGWL